MYKVIKNKGKFVKAYQLGSNQTVIKELISCGKIKDLGDGRYQIYSQEVEKERGHGEIAQIGDWIKLDGKSFPYPNNKDYFEMNHRHIKGDVFEQIPKSLLAWDLKCEICPEINFLITKKGLKINKASFKECYSAKLWGTTEIAAADAVIIFYHIDYDENGFIIDADFNFVEREEFERTYSVI